MECYVGLDVHSKASVFVIQDARGQVRGQGAVPTTPEGFRRWHEGQCLPAGTPVALETGTVAFFVARELTGLGCEPVVVDAREVRLKAHRPTQKSDRRDAFELCDGLRRGIYRAIVHVPPRPVARLRELLSRRRHFVRLETAQVNAVKRLLRGAGLGHLSRSLGTEVGWTKLLATVAGHGELRDYIDPHRALWRCARTQRIALETTLTAHLAAPAFAPDLRRLQTIPGVGPIVGATVLAVSPTCAGSGTRNTPRAMRGWSPPPITPGTGRRTGASPNAGPGNCAPCCARPLTMPVARPIRSIRTLPTCVRNAATRWRASPWPTGLPGSRLRCCATGRTSTSRS